LVPKKKIIPKKRYKLREPVRIRFKIEKKSIPKEFIYKIPTKTIAITMYALRWFLFLILVYIIISVTAMLLMESYAFLQQIVTLSIGGFFGFFMGYFGWLFAHQITTWLSGKKREKDILNELRF